MRAVQDWWRQAKAAGARRAKIQEEDQEEDDIETSAGSESDSEYEPMEKSAGRNNGRKKKNGKYRYAGHRYAGSEDDEDEAPEAEEVVEKTAGRGRRKVKASLRRAASRLQGAANRARARSRSESRSRSPSVRAKGRRDRARGAALQRAANRVRALSRRVGGADTSAVRSAVMARASALRQTGVLPGPALSQAWREARRGGSDSTATPRAAGRSSRAAGAESTATLRTTVASRAAGLRRENPAMTQSDAMRRAWQLSRRC